MMVTWGRHRLPSPEECAAVHHLQVRTGHNHLICCAFLTRRSLVAGEEFQHILRVLNTNVDGKQNVMYAMTAIRGIGRRFANLVCKKAEVDMTKR